MRLHRQYGNGLSNLKTNLVNGGHHGLKQSADGDPSMNGMNADGTIMINNYLFDTTSWKSLPLGVISGLQYSNATWGKCFYAMVDTLNFVDYFQADITNLFENYDFYSLMVYDPIHFLSNYLVLYE